MKCLLRIVMFFVLLGLPFCAAAQDARQDAAAPEQSPDGELIDVGGTELFVRRMGAGEPMIVVHGGPVLEHGYFLPHLERLAENYELIFYDQRLSGRSSATAPPESLRLKAFAQDIETLRTKLDLGGVHLLGHSWGGLIAMRYATLYPESLRSLVLANSMAPTAALWQEEQKAAAASLSEEHQARAAEIRAGEDFAARRPSAIRELLLHSFSGQLHDPSKISALELYVPNDYIARSGGFGAMMGDLQSYDLIEALSAVDIPTLILYGASEPGAEISGSAMRGAVPNASFAVLPECGHFPFLECPEAFFSKLEVFLQDLKRNDLDR